MKHSSRWTTPAFLGILIALLAAVLFYPDAGQAAPILTTDKADYYAAETVTVTGAGFAPNTQYDVPIIRPDGSMVKGDGTLTPGWDTVTSNGLGNFTYLYKLDGIFGSYEVRAYPSSWSGNLAEGPLTSVTFTDADIHFSQCANDDNGDNAPEACRWVEGALNTNNSIYTEGDAVPHRLFHKLTSVGAYQFQFEYDFSKSDVYAYDFLTSPDQGPQSTLALLNPCDDKPGFASACSTITNSLYTGATAVTIASDPFDSVPGAEAAIVTREMKVACSGPGSCSAIAAFFPSGNGLDDPGENHFPDVDPADCHNATATKCDTMSVKIRVSVTTPAGTSNSSPTLVAIWFGGHLSLESYWGTTCGAGSTTKCGASSIPGAPFHMQYDCIDEPDSPDQGCGGGGRDNPMSADTVSKGTIVITKDVVTQSGTHPQDFSFSCSPTLGSFTLDDDGANGNPLNSSQAFAGIPAATYTCTESAPPAGWSLTSLTCVDPSSGTTVNLGTRTATIDLDNGETINCTYTNTATGTINIVKDAVPNDAQDFGFTCTSPLGSFSLDDDANGTLSNTQTFSSTLAGSYTCTESAPPSPWSLAGISCSDPDGGTPSSPTPPTATIDLDPGETVSCTYTNVKGGLTIVKNAVPDDPQDFAFTGTCFGSFSLDDDGANGNPLDNMKTGPVGVGSCTVTESPPAAGWTLTGIVCSDPDGGTTTSGATVTVDVDAGESIVCTFENTGMGTIKINKVCDPPGDLQPFTITRSYGNVTLGCGGTDTTNLPPATYSVSETPPAGWDLTGATCLSSIGDTETPSSIELDAGETVTCTFTNQKDANIIVCKQTDPNGDPQAFTFTPSYGANFSLTDGNCNDSGDLSPGTYSVAESPTAGWVLLSSSCSDGSSIGSISLSAGETVTCTFNNTKTGSITIVKNAIPNGTQGFYFTCSAPIGPFTLDDDGTNGNPFDSSKVTSGLLPGTYTCTEVLPSGWALTSLTCIDPSGGTTTTSTPVFSPGSGTATIALAAGENVTCTFVNTELGSITIIKDAVPDGTTAFSFTCSSPIGSFNLDDDGTNGNPLNNSKTQGSLMPGSYSCSETVPLGWALTSISCGGDTDSGSVVALPGITIDLDAGEDITCTFANNQGSITIIKNTVPNGPQDFCFNGALPDANGGGTGDFCLDDDGDITLSSSHSANVPPGTYAVNELGPTAEFDLTAITCVDPDSGTTVNLGTSTATIDLDAGESITCTFTNRQRGHIIVDKVTNPPASSQSFEFDPSYGANFFLTDAAAANDSGALVPGPYSVAEVNIPSTWVLTGLLCVDPDSGSTVNVGTATATIDLDAGETVTCTFENTENGSVVINKNCSGGNDTFGYTGSGSGIPASFNIACVAGSGSQTYSNIVPGPKTVTESSLPADWVFTSLVCSDPDNGSSPSGTTANIDLDPGETVTCTYTNTKNGHVLVDKVTNPSGSSQSFEFDPSYGSNFFLTDGAPLNDSGPLAPGAYSVAEVNIPAEWTLTGSSCSSSIGDPETPASIELDAGEAVTCTFNDRQAGHIRVDKVTDPSGSTQSFEFDPSYGANFFLTDAAPVNDSGPLTPGPGYSVAEVNIPSDWTLTGSSCSDGSNPASINLGAGEVVTCTFNDQLKGKITIVKDVTSPPGTHPQDFSFTCSAPVGSFQLDDDADGTLSNTKGPVNATPGTYSCSEAAVPGWTQTGASCNDGSPVTAISVGVGEPVTCTFENTLNAATFTVYKDFTDKPSADTTTVSVTLTCGAGAIVAPNPKPASEAAPAVFTVTGLSTPTTCTASEGTPPAGYSATGCTVPVTLPVTGSASCTITNTLNSATFIVYKDFSDKPATDTTTVSVTLACGAGTITLPNPKPASEAAPAVFTVTGLASPTSCTASEGTAPAGYIASGCTVPVTLAATGTASCIITNTFVTTPPVTPPPAVGGTVSLITGEVVQSSSNTADVGVALGALGAGTVLVLAGVWVARRRLYG